MERGHVCVVGVGEEPWEAQKEAPRPTEREAWLFGVSAGFRRPVMPAKYGTLE